MKAILATYTPTKWEEGEEVPDVVNARAVLVIKIAELKPDIIPSDFQVIFIDANGKMKIDDNRRFSECAPNTRHAIQGELNE